MNRRAWLLVAAVGLGLAASGCSGQSGPGSVSVSTEKLQAMVAQRFPRQYPVAGLLQLQLQAPVLRIGLHPADARCDSARHAMLRHVERALEHRAPITYSSLL